MNQKAITFLQAIIVLISIAAVSAMIRMPLTEGRAATLNLFSIYSDPFILYGYAASAPFFTALYHAFKLLGLIKQNKAFSPESAKAAKTIQYCAIVQSILIVLAAILIRLFHNKEDDPAGFIALCIAATFICIIIATTAGVFAKLLQQGTAIKLENEQLRYETKK